MRVTGPLLKVLACLVDRAEGDVYGLELVRATGLKSGTLYPLLDRLEKQGLVASSWETKEPSQLGRPRRRLYRLTSNGIHEARQIFVEHSAGAFRWT
jgi:DNA-binding PadR family transcriptional regulator